MSVGDATRHPFRVVVETPRGPNTVAIRNNGGHDFPLAASVGAESVDRVPSNSTAAEAQALLEAGGGHNFTLDAAVESVAVLLATDGRPLHAAISVGPRGGRGSTLLELYAEDGLERWCFCVLETPGEEEVLVTVLNTAVESRAEDGEAVLYPMSASVVPFSPEAAAAEAKAAARKRARRERAAAKVAAAEEARRVAAAVEKAAAEKAAAERAAAERAAAERAAAKKAAAERAAAEKAAAERAAAEKAAAERAAAERAAAEKAAAERARAEAAAEAKSRAEAKAIGGGEGAG